MTVAAVVPAAGVGERLGAGRPKALVEVAGRPLLRHAVDALRAVPAVEVVVVAAPAERLAEMRAAVPGATVVAGGATRQESVRRALAALGPEVDLVLVHDAARAFVPVDVVERVLERLYAGAPAVVPVLPVADTVKEVDPAGRIVRTVDRAALRAVQTPQGFRRDLLERAHRLDAAGTDDAALVEALGVAVDTVAGSAEAFKVTTPHDLAVADAVLAQREQHVGA